MAVVVLQQVSKIFYRGATVIHALRDVSVQIGRGEFCALVGPSGSGKSTLLHLLAGLDRPTSGEIFLNGHSTLELTDDQWTAIRRTEIGIVFQAFHLVPGLTVEENVALPLRLQGHNRRAIRARVREMLDLVKMGHRARHRPYELSGGEQQRVAVARAFVHRPRLIIADEPTGNLDSRNGDAIVELLRHSARTFGRTVVLATHSEAAACAADRRLCLHDGQLVMES
ncbi:MAG: ABC transporter ATP-binding protein [Nitrospirae bacterium]|nr:MAG: ABC transporter ATP-binding protein [Nitrospirota bacterium]